MLSGHENADYDMDQIISLLRDNKGDLTTRLNMPIPPTAGLKVTVQEKVLDGRRAILISKAGCMVSVSFLVGRLALFFP